MSKTSGPQEGPEEGPGMMGKAFLRSGWWLMATGRGQTSLPTFLRNLGLTPLPLRRVIIRSCTYRQPEMDLWVMRRKGGRRRGRSTYSTSTHQQAHRVGRGVGETRAGRNGSKHIIGVYRY